MKCDCERGHNGLGLAIRDCDCLDSAPATALFTVEVRATVRRFYHVDAENEKDAESKSCGAQPDHEEDEDAETMSIVRVNPETKKSQPDGRLR